MNESFTEVFIKLVHQKPELWDTRSKNYRDRFRREECWKTIARKFIKNFDHFPEGIKKRKCSGYQRKWKNIVNAVKSELVKQQVEMSGPTTSKRKPYRQYNNLTFLLPSLKHEQPGLFYTVQRDELRNQPGHENSGYSNETANGKQHRAQDGMSNKKSKKRAEVSEINKTLRESLKRKIQQEDLLQDEDTLFLISLHKYLKSIPSHKKMVAKAQLLVVLHEHNKP